MFFVCYIAETPVAVTVDIYLASLDSISEMNMVSDE